MSNGTSSNPFSSDCPCPGCFCGREKELATLRSYLENGANVVLTGVKGIGKRALIERLFREQDFRKNFFCMHADLTRAASMQDLAEALVKALQEALREDRGSPTVLSGPERVIYRLTGRLPSELRADARRDPFGAVDAFMTFFRSREIRAVLAFDGFERIASLKEGSAEGRLRGHIQLSPHLRVVYAGNDFAELSSMFMSYRRPFYASSAFLNLADIPRAEFEQFAQARFRRTGRELPSEVFKRVYEFSHGHTETVRRLLHDLYETVGAGGTATAEDFECILDAVLAEKDAEFCEFTACLSDSKLKLMTAVAETGPTTVSLDNAAFLSAHGLDVMDAEADSVALEKQGLIRRDFLAVGLSERRIADPFLAEHLRRKEQWRRTGSSPQSKHSLPEARRDE